MFIVYKHTCPNGKVYIGITCQTPSRRWRRGEGYADNIHFFRAIRKYGWDNIKHEIMFDGLTKEEACEKEVLLIREYDSTNLEKGYNISKGGEHSLLSDETKRKISEAQTGRTAWNKGRKMDAETYEKVKKTMFKKGCSIRLGVKSTAEARLKMSLAHKGKRCRKINQYSVDGEFIREWNSIKEASESLSIPSSKIISCCQGKCKKTHNYKFEYLN